MALIEQMSAEEMAQLTRLTVNSPHKYVWTSYDSEADVLYINFKKPSVATDSEPTEDDIIIRYEGKEIIGLTVLHASKRVSQENL